MACTTRKRWLYLAITFALLCFFGLIYAWSLFVEPLETEFGWLRSDTSLIFTISCATVCIGMTIAGALETVANHRVVMFIAAILVAGGFLGSSHCSTLVEFFVYYGVLVGTGVGIGFNCAISVAMKWFPDKQGVASGALLMGYGAGAMLLSPLATALLAALDWRTTFAVLGVLFGMLMVLGSALLREPTAEEAEPLVARAREYDVISAEDRSPAEMAKTPSFWICFVWLALCTSGGLALISQAVPAAMEILAPASASAASQGSLALATAAMGSVSLCNGLGRLLNGFIWDKFGYRVSLTWISLAFCAGMASCGIALHAGNFPLLVLGFMLLGLMFGGTMSTTSASVATFYGTKHFGINYAIMCCQMIPAAFIGPLLLAAMQTGSGSYEPAFWAFLIVAVVTFAVSFAVRRPQEQATRKPDEKASPSFSAQNLQQRV